MSGVVCVRAGEGVRSWRRLPWEQGGRTREVRQAVIGQDLGRYRILDKIGEGGMGAVYRAEDRELQRKVALKVLPPELAADPDRIERFRREARAVARLNHPNIVTIYSVEEDGGTRFLTMELVEGESLDQSIPRGGCPSSRSSTWRSPWSRPWS